MSALRRLIAGGTVMRRTRPSPHIARVALQEAASRRLLLIGLVVSGAFVGLFSLATWLVHRDLADATAIEQATNQTFLTVLGLYAVQFLASFLAIVLGAGTVAGELASGRALAVLARPLSRWSWLLQRMGTFAALAASYVLVMAGGVLAVSWLLGGYVAHSAAAGVGLLILQTLVLLVTAAAVSTRLSTTAAASVVAALYGLAWLGGVAEFVGILTDNDAVSRLGVATSLVMPSDALWHGASYHLASPLFLAAARSISDTPPFLSVMPPNLLRMGWAVLHVLVAGTLSVYWLNRRDL
jgi:Cu-processing system permease protein